jgi:ATP-dependent Lon protease
VGPPGVGKTSIARSIARATGREFVRVSLGGVRDEAEIRGHRRTYIGALPGKLIQNLKKAGSNNPLFLLDEVDKMSTDFRGDPASALLEVLDPEQNACFNDHYLDMDYDLSEVLFITTANTLGGIPIPLQDRMEIIQLSGYTEYEKLNIARKYLIPRKKAESGLEAVDIDITDNAIRTVIHHYTKESGVRNLERELGSICRKIALRVVKGPSGDKPAEKSQEKPEKIVVQATDVPGYLDVPKYRLGKKESQDQVGLTHGLSVSDYGGDILDCEVAVVPGKGKQVITGLLEKGMEESAQAAMSYIRSRAGVLSLETEFYQKVDVHVHFPDFIRKDGPSAGVTMATSIASALTRIPVRNDVAMTGEITLRGRVMPIGGLKEKLLAAHRGGITTVLIPRENQKDLRDVPRRVIKALRIVLVDHMDDVLREALVLDDPAAMFGERQVIMEYREGEYFHQEATPPAPGAPRLGELGELGDRPGAS